MMRKLFTLLFLFVLSCVTVSTAQTDIAIGTGNVGNGTTTYPAPLQDYWEGHRQQYLYRASELTAAGMGPGFISALKWNVLALTTSTNAFPALEQYTIKIGGTTIASLGTTTWEPVSSTVYGPIDYLPVMGVNTFNFSQPFFWNGTDNIIVEVCGGDPNNASDLYYTNNSVIPWTTGLSFNASRVYAADNLGNACGTTLNTNGSATTTATSRPNVTFSWTPAATCNGMPTAGNAVSTLTTILCAGSNFTVSLSGATVATGLTYQWQSSTDNVNFTNIAAGTSSNYTTTQTAPVMYYRAIVTCGGQSATSGSVQVTVNTAPQYATLPYNESFENEWLSACNTRELPNQFWRNTPGTGNNSWRRNDDGASGAWTSITTGAYTPTGSVGNFSARFHSDIATNGSKGQLDLHFDGNTAASAKRLMFDYINTTGNDSLVVLLSTNGGTSFVRLDSFRTTSAWSTKTITFTTTSATSIIRFEGTADAGVSDIGLDNIILTTFADCSGTPVGGTTSTTKTNVCVGETFTISFTGSTDGNGISYQWQRSIDGGTTWTDITGQTGFTYTGTQVQTTLYRVLVRCSFSNASAPSTAVQVSSPTPVIGNYTINNGAPTNIPARTFNSFNDAYNFIKCGIAGAVTFNVQTSNVGPYNEQLIMDAVPGASQTFTVTFKGDGTAAIGFNATTNTQRAIIKLRAADHIIFDSLIINANTGTYGYGVQLVNITGGDGADFNVVRNCIINSSMTASNGNFAGIVVSGSDTDPIATGSNVVADNNTFENNTIIGGFYGITLSATFTGGANGNNNILYNDIKDFHQTGIYIAGSYGTNVVGNRLHRPSRTTVGAFTGILATAQKSTLLNVAKNRIYNPYGGAPTNASTFTGISFENADGTSGTGENFVSNNSIFRINGNGAWTGINNISSDYVYYMHNTIDFNDSASTATAATRAFNQQTAAASLFFYNNMISITRGGSGSKHAMYLASGTLAGLDFNNYFVGNVGTNNFTGFLSSNRATLADWRTATNDEAGSYAINPYFVNRASDDRIPGNAAIDNKGLFVGVPDDINDVPRADGTPTPTNPNGNPDIGAHEFTPPPCVIPPATGPVAITPTITCQNTPVSLTANVGPYGSAQTFQWQTSTTQSGTYTSIGTPMNTPDTTIMASSTLWYRLAITCSGVTVFTDAVQLTVNPALPAGTYTINNGQPTTYAGPNTGTNFASFNDAKNAMFCGILGAVTFNVDANSGPYVEQLILDSIKGASEIFTVTFNGNGRTIRFSPSSTSGNERAVIKLKGADHIIFDSLVIDATGGTFGYGVQLINNADSNTIRRSTIITPVTTSTNFAGIVVNATDAGVIATGNTLSDGNTFQGNTVIGGFYGATLIGSTTSTAYINNNKFIGNTFRDFYSTGIQVTGTSNTVIEGNRFSRPTITNHPTIVYGVFATVAPSLRLKITRNRFHNFFTATPTSTSVFYGVNHNNVDVSSGSENEVSNNLFYNIEHNGPLYAMYNTSADNVNYYHNTVSLDNTASTATGATAGFFQTTTAVGINFQNNLITISRGGNGLKHGLYLATTASEIISDYNNIFLNGTNSYFGFSGGNRLSLADWRLATNKDMNSFDINPLYVDSANGNYAPGITPLNDKGNFVGVSVDINLAPRPTDPNAPAPTPRPDIGAFEFMPPTCANPPVAGTATVTPNSSICLETPLRLDITGHSPVGSITFQWFSSPDGTNWTPLSGIQYGPRYDTLATTNTYYRAAVTCNGVTTFTNVVQVTLGNILPAGTYTISSSPTTYPGGTNFQGFQSAVNAMQCGIGGKIVFNVAAGTYDEQIRIGNIRGVTAARTVTFQSANGDPSSVNLTYNSTTATNYTLRLDSTRYFIFKNLTISATNATFGRAVELAGNSSYDSILNCVITTPVAGASTPNIVGVYAGGFRGTEIVVKGNTINNGSYGVFFTGVGQAANLTVNQLIDSNTVNNAFAYGIYTSFHKRANITRNTVNVTSPASPTTYGIYANDNDSVFNISGNRVNINNTTSNVYGIYVNNSDSSLTELSRLANNIVASTGTNTGWLYGIYMNNSHGHMAVNNVVSLNNTGTTSWGLWTNSTGTSYWNNSIKLTATSTTNGYAAYFQTTASTNMSIRNNIFSNEGGGRAMYVNATNQSGASDYNMLYTTGSVLVQRGTPAASFNTLGAWSTASFWDANSIVYQPAFANNTTLQPNLSNPDVWAMHGRGVQIPANNVDFNGQARPTTLTAGVPDLGAYEFYPTVQPTVLTAIPAVPAPNTTQAFMYGTDTVMKVTWGATAPPTVEGRRFSGVVPQGLPAGMDSMYFYTKLESPAGGTFPYTMELFYLDPWQGSIPDQNQLGLGKTTPSLVNWVVGFSSRVEVRRKLIRQTNLDFFDKFTGLLNPYAPPVLPEKDSSNRGRKFWVAYGHHQSMGDGGSSGAQNMVLYLSAQEPTTVKVTLNSTGWTRTYNIPANTAIATDPMPKVVGGDDARIVNEGFFNRGISIESQEPIEAYAHTYDGANSGATMLFPVGVYGYEYITLNSSQYYASNTYSWSLVIADKDNTVVEITPSVTTRAGRPAGVPFTVTLNKGEVYNIMGTTSGSAGTDLTGTKFKSIPNSNGDCFPIAVFAGSSRTALCNTSNGDNMINQIFPYSAWGKRYATFLTAQSTSTTNYNTNKFRVLVKDPTTIVMANGNQLTGMVTPGNYYDFFINSAGAANAGVYIEADKPVLVAQYLISTSATTGGANGCPGITSPTGVGDPSMIYLSPIEQGIKKAIFYNTNASAITGNYINVVIPTPGLASLKIDNQSVFTHTFPHPTLPGYTCVRQNLPATAGQHSIESDSAFTAITYGLGSVESYGYLAGTLVKSLNALGAINNTLDTLNQSHEYTCVGSPFRITALLPLQPTSITWKFSAVPGLNPGRDTTISNPVSLSTQVINGTTYYEYSVNQDFTLATPGLYPVQIFYAHPDVESCDNTRRDVIYIQVLPSPKTNFTINFTGCEGETAQFVGDAQTDNGVTINNWRWTFHDNSVTTGQNTSYTYNTPGTFNVTLRTVTPDGCLGDSTKPVVVNPKPVVNVVTDSLNACTGASVTYNVANPATGVTYNWYSTSTGGTPISTGTSFTINPITGPAEYFVEAVSAVGCTSDVRKRVVLTTLSPFAPTVATVTGSGPSSVTFTWTAVPGASSYQVSLDNGVTFITPSSGAQGLTHTASGLSTLQSVCIIVRANGSTPCETSISAPVCGCAVSSAVVVTDSIAVCSGADATFNIQSPAAGVTYTWYNAATGGTAVGTGSTFTATAITGTSQFWVEQTTAAGCSSAVRTRVVASVLTALAQPVVTVSGANATSVSFTWAAVPGATGYQVSTNGGTTFGAVSTNTTHTVSGLTSLQSVCIIVRAVGANSCQNSQSTEVCGCNVSTVVVTPTTTSICSGSTTTFNVQSPVAGSNYNWYTTATGGTPIYTGSSFTTPAVTGTTEYFVEQSAGGCTSPTRTRVEVTVLAPLAVPVPTMTSATANSITFTWSAVPGATGYQVSTDNGTTFGAVTSSTTHTITGLNPMQQATIVVRAVGNIACQNSTSAAVTGRSLGDQVFIPNTFTPNGDGVNDVLQVYGDIVREVVFMVFNQWGEKIHESRDKNRVWDGTSKGKNQPVGVYIYACRVTLLDGSVIERKGSINLVR
ncbi:gliding motility-associated C-terminal domain-containing protein [Aridibaculum aurantiacum]|uniref:Ig-like domain-containing protein n=1 Tax=Aridibaculum aurantiacum TaxID=2810307 RepID=UPI001A959002|nr:gliding motility-associated C-terminal domain-containing protein [Aridibaculum aurantiacum]